jgi:hypothetical protein
MNRRYAPMVGPSKILTVSYGTFSCTLEGFDDPFSTMKSIAEYFRDLAADDRYFGAEPPQPDPAMLHRIAEREVHRRVEARVQDNGVILRAADAPAGAAVSPAQPTYTPTYTPAGAGSALSESVAAKLQRLRHAAAATPALVPVPEEAELLPDLPTPPVAAAPNLPPAVTEPEAPARAEAAPAATPVPVPVAEELPESAIAVAEVAAEPEAAADESSADDAAVEEEIVAAAVEDVWAMDAEDELADKVEPAADFADEDDVDTAKIMAEAIEDWGQPEEASAADPAIVAAEDDDADLMESLAVALAGPVEQITPEAAAEDDSADDALLAALIDDAEETAAAVAAEATEEADDAAFEAALLAATADPDAFTEDEVATDTVEEGTSLWAAEAFAAEAELDDDLTDAAAPADQPEQEITAAAAEEPAGEAPAEPEEVASAQEDPVLTQAEAAQGAEPAVAEADPVGDQAPAAEVAESAVSAGKLQRARARVIKIRRAAPKPAASTLTPEAEADLARELEDLKAEAPTRTQLPEVSAETSVQRLIDQTNSQLDGVENRRRHAAIAHLKAAVAATVADRRATGGADDAGEQNRLDAYRSDLERVVRPRRPTSSGEKTDIPGVTSTMRPAPLVLVSAQRIDRPEPTAVPIRPRRVGGGGSALALTPEMQAEPEAEETEEDESQIAPAGGFAEFAERLGAQELPDLLEAAVAYAACVEGRPHVSRPYMLRQVGAVMAEGEGARDEMLKGFGRLLRIGRIEKVRAGLYALPGSSRMMAEAKKIGA